MDLNELVKNAVTEKVVELTQDFQQKTEAYLNDKFAELQKINPVYKISVNNTLYSGNIGLRHFQFDKILKLVLADFNIYIYGKAGSGKSYIAKQIADLLNLDFIGISVNYQTTKSDLIGFISANGSYVESAFYKAYKEGKIFLIDEIDSSNGNVIMLLNNATSNGFFHFPNGETVQKHKDFRLIATGNTNLNGNDSRYNNRFKIDFAVSDRFIFVELLTDFTLISNLLNSLYPNNEKVNKYFDICLQINNQINSFNFDSIQVTQRTILNGAKLIINDIDIKSVLEMVLFKGTDIDVKTRILNNIKF